MSATAECDAKRREAERRATTEAADLEGLKRIAEAAKKIKKIESAGNAAA